ncbi:MAG: hypothetical protein DRQ60_10795, partial [Gammaproteobacteria bacterium]
MVLRVYHDGFVESAETAIIDFTVNANGGDGVADTNADTFILTINDDDLAPIASQNMNVLFEDFEDATGWVILDGDGDGNNWGIFADQGWSPHQYSGNWAGSYSYNGSPLFPNNYLISPQFTIPANVTSATVNYIIGSADESTYYKEHYSAYFTTDKSSEASILAGTALESDREIPANGTEVRNHDLISLAGQTGYFVVRHHNVTDEFILGLDTVSIDVAIESGIQTAVNDGLTNDSQDLATSGTIYTSDSSTGDVMLDVTNNQADDYGCLDISVSRSGTGAQSYNGSSFPNLVMDKTFDISPVNTVYAGDVSVTFYFTEAEIAGWETATGLSRTALTAGREFDGTIIETSTLAVGSFGTNVTLTGTFSGLDDTFVFGPAGVSDLSICSGVIIWDGSGWLNAPSPSNSLVILVAEDFDTSTDGSLEGCKIIVGNNKTLTIGAGEYLKTQDEIIIRGTLNVLHEGSVVQVNDGAEVINNGTIEVIKRTPVATGNSFSILGSPMSGTTRNGAFIDNNVVMNHDTNLFNLDPAVTAINPLSEHFADQEGDNWLFMTGTVSINPSEGYLVGPTTVSVSTNFYDLTYSQGTLNNGVYNYNVIYKNIGTLTENKSNSPNILSNPYASAIDVDKLILANTSIIDEVYYWEHLTAPSSGYPGYRFENWSMGDISMRNSGGGVAAPNGGAPIPTQYMPSGQGFAIKANAAGTVVFNNSMRVTGNNDGYRRGIAAIDRIYLKVENPTYQLNSSALISFTDGATDGYDAKYDANRLATPISIYSIVEEKELAIQGRSVFNENHIIPLGFRTMVEEVQIYT